MENKELKEELLTLCEGFVKGRINNAEKAMNDAQDSANGEIKSSAGDKHETSRAMAHIEQEKNAKQLDEAIKLKRALLELKKVRSSEIVGFGSLVITNQGAYYISLSLGAITNKGVDYFLVSPTSPIATALKGCRVNDSILFNGREFIIEKVF